MPERLRERNALARRWLALREDGMKIRAAAKTLGVSEAGLLATLCGGEDAVALNGDFPGLLKALPLLGEVSALTRNDGAVLKVRGVFGPPALGGGDAEFSGPVGVRLRLENWSSSFAVRERIAGRIRRSLHFFDASGTAAHKVYLRDDLQWLAFESLVEKFRGTGPDPGEPSAEPGDVARITGRGRARAVTHLALRRTLAAAARDRIPLTIVVGCPGAVQCRTGLVDNVRVRGDWISVVDAGVHFNAREDLIASSWVTEKPAAAGSVHGLELFDEEGRNIAMIFGSLGEGFRESPAWLGLLRGLEALG